MDKNNNTLSEVRKTAAQRMWDAENKQRAKSDASNKRTPSSIPVPDKKMKTEGATGAKPGWMLRQDPVLGNRVKAAQAKQKEFKKLVGTKVPVKPTPTQGVEEEASPMIKPPSNRFDNKKEAFTHAKTHGGKVFRSTYIDPNTGNKNITFVVKKEQGVAEARDPREYDYEGDMAKSQLRSIIANAQRAHDMLEDDTNMAEWVQSKITLAADYISTVADYMQSQVNEEAKKGLYYNVNKRKKAGTSRSKNHPDAPSAQDWKDAAKTAKEEVELSELNKDTVISYAIRAHKDQDKQFTAIGKGIRNNDPKSANKASHKFSKRAAGLDRVETRLNKESKSFFDIRKELDERNLTPVEKIAREELSKMKYKKVRGAPTE